MSNSISFHLKITEAKWLTQLTNCVNSRLPLSWGAWAIIFLSLCFSSLIIPVKAHHMHIEPKSCKLLGKLVVQYGIRAWFGGRSRVWAASLQFTFPLFVSLDMNSKFCLLDINPNLFVFPRAGMGPHVREVVKEHDMHIELKSCKLKLLGKLVVQ